MEIKITNVADNEDGTVTVSFVMDYESLFVFAKHGLKTALMEMAEEKLEEQKEPTDEHS